MFDKIKRFFSSSSEGIETKSINGTLTTLEEEFNTGTFDKFNAQEIIKILDGYQYISADIVAKTCASQNLRLYANNSNRRSKNHSGNKQILVKNIPVSQYKKNYLMGENTEVSHDNIRYKTLSADSEIVEILDHPALDILRRPNPYMTKWSWLYSTVLAMQFFGNGYNEKVRFTNGEIAELWYTPAQFMEIIQGETYEDFIKYYKWGECFGNPKIIATEDMMDFKIPGIGNSQVYGKSKVEVAWKYIGLINSSLSFQKAITDNTGRPDIIIIAEDAKTNAEDLFRLQSRWNDRHYGPKQAGKMSTIPGKVKVEVLPRSEFDFDSDTSLVRAIARAFGLPEYKVLPSSAIKANDSTQEKDFMKETIDSYLTLIEDVLNNDFITEWDDSNDLFFAFDPVVKEDIKFKLEKQVKLTNAGILSINQAKAQEGLPPVEGGDDARVNGRSIISIDNASVPTPATSDDESDDIKSIREEVSTIIDKIAIIEPKQIEVPPMINLTVNGAEIEVIEEEETS